MCRNRTTFRRSSTAARAAVGADAPLIAARNSAAFSWPLNMISDGLPEPPDSLASGPSARLARNAAAAALASFSAARRERPRERLR